MKNNKGKLFSIVITMLLLMATSQTSFATTLSLDKSCDDATGLTTNCYQTLAKLQERIWGVAGSWGITTPGANTLNPDASNPVTVNIGPGVFEGVLACLSVNNSGYATFRGNGRASTTLTTAGDVNVFITGCGNIHFQDLTIFNDFNGGLDTPIYITHRGNGDTSWSNVTLESVHGVGWYEVTTLFSSSPGGCQAVGSTAYPAKKPEHFFFGARIIGGITPFVSACSLSWLYGSDILLKSSPTATLALPLASVFAYGEGDVRLFGSTVRMNLSSGLPQGVTEVKGIELGNGSAIPTGTLHMHGGIINVTTPSGIDAIGINASQANTLAHTLDTAFVVSAGTGADSIRLQGPGQTLSPLLWQSGTTPPNNGNLTSFTGKDVYVETDCDSNGCNGGDQPHMMLYSETCGQNGGSPWFDVVTGDCRT